MAMLLNKASILFVVLTLVYSCKDSNNENKKISNTSEKNVASTTVFKKISPSESGLVFSNNLKENVATLENLFNFDYFYNGSGVAVGDINNDGLPDVFFTGNQVPNKLFLNKGNLKFEDISEKAGINNGKHWANGVTFADVNNDGWLDIYVSQGGPKRAPERKNLLFINQKDLTFKESAQSFGLADMGISTQSVFFDYDNDGDLDCLVSNENEFYGIDPSNFYKLLQQDQTKLHQSSIHLYQNDNLHFTDVSKQAGILMPSFGLGVTVSDINNDGWLDFYIANDYFVPDALFINQKNKTFKNTTKETMHQVSFYGMGVDIADFNNDLQQDIFVLDMASSDHVRAKTLMASMNLERFSLLVDKLKMPYQYMYNSLQLNVGNNKFHNIVQMANLAKTDWSWAGLMVDLDLDGNKDIYVTNGYRKYGKDNDISNQIKDVQRAFRGNVPLKMKQKLYDALPSEKLSNLLFKNNNDLTFNNKTIDWGLYDPSFSNGAVYADLDNDGDYELLVNNIDQEAFLYKNNTIENKKHNFLKVVTNGNTSEPFAKVFISSNGVNQMIETKRVKGYLSATQKNALFGLGTTKKVDTVRVLWRNGKFEEKYNIPANTTLTFNYKDATKNYVSKQKQYSFKEVSDLLGINFKHKENQYNDFAKEILLPYKQSTLGPFLSKGDINDDGLEDVFVGGAAGQAGALFLQTKSGFIKNVPTVFVTDKNKEDMESVFFDFDKDGDLDLYVVSGGNEFPSESSNYTDRLYINNGKGNFTKFNDPVLNSIKESGKSVSVIDYDKDGDLDVLIGNRIVAQHYPVAAPSFLLQNNGTHFTNVTDAVIPDLKDFGIINKIVATDFNNDGWEDIIAVGEWTPIGVFLNQQGKFKNISSNSNLENEKGWWFTIGETDINNDGFKDYIIGNVGTNIKHKASYAKPFKVYASDFDDNGTFDIVLSSMYKGKEVPSRGRECSSQQMPFIAQKFETYNAFAHATLEDIFGEKLNQAYKKEATQFKSVLLINNGDLTFTKTELPPLAQTAPLMSIQFLDYNKDGKQDAIIAGNIYNTEVETPRLDMGTGVVLVAQDNTYKALGFMETGLYLEGNVKSILEIYHKGLDKNYLLAGRNNDSVILVACPY